MAVKTLLVDEDPELRLSLRKGLEKERDIEVVGEAAPGSPVLALIRVAEPDVVLLDIQSSPDTGLDMARLIRGEFPELPVVAMGPAANGRLRAEAAQAGASAYFPKKRAELVTAIRSVLNGKGRRFLDGNDGVSQRPVPESFVAVTDEAAPRKQPQRKPPQRKPAGGDTARRVRVEPAAAPVVEPATPPMVEPAAPVVASEPVAARAVEPVVVQAAESVVARAVESVTAPVVGPVDVVAVRRRPARSVVVPADTKTKEKTASPRGSHGTSWDGSRETQPRKARRSRKQDHVPEPIDVRGPTGLPRRHGGHR